MKKLTREEIHCLNIFDLLEYYKQCVSYKAVSNVYYYDDEIDEIIDIIETEIFYRI